MNKVERILSLALFGEEFLVGMEGYGFQLWKLKDGKLFSLKLPDGVRNIPLRPMATNTPSTVSGDLGYFIAGIRNSLYIFDIEKESLGQFLCNRS